MMSGNGKIHITVSGNPARDRLVFQHERILVPWKLPFEAPNISGCLPEVRKLMLEGKYQQALELSFEEAARAGMPPGTQNHRTMPAFIMKIDQAGKGKIRNFLRTTDFESGEIKVMWDDDDGSWLRTAFVSRPDNMVVQSFSAPEGSLINTRISLETSIPQTPRLRNGPATESQLDMDLESIRFDKDFNEKRFILTGHFGPATGNHAYVGGIRIISDGGTIQVDGEDLVVKNAKSLMLLTRIEYYKGFHDGYAQELLHDLDQVKYNYQELLSRNREAQSAIFNRSSLNFSTGERDNALSGEELLIDQKKQIGYNLTLLSKLYDMCRYWLMLESGDFPPIHGHLNINVNLQVSGGDMANLPEAMNAFYNWIEGVLPDSRKNAENIFGARGALFSVHPDQQQGVLYHWDFAWPHHYWISAGGWVYSQFWDRYLTTGDTEFLKKRVIPGLKELALFYEDYLAETDENGNYIFVPSYSPESWPSNTYEGSTILDGTGARVNAPTVINATMDIMVCRQVLTNLIKGARILGIESENIPKWESMLVKMPNYLLDEDGALKEWSWPSFAERQDHRHISQLYGVWPSDEITPELTPELATASWLANRKRAQGNASGHGISHRMLAAARLKDNYLVNFELKQLLEQGYFGPVLTSSHNPYTGFMPDQQGSVLSLLIEMLVYSRPGVIEVLPAIPETIRQGNIKGVLSRSFARIDELKWDLDAKKVDLTITSFRDQEISFVSRYGITSILAPPATIIEYPEKGSKKCDLQLYKDKTVTISLELGELKPSDWISGHNGQ